MLKKNSFKATKKNFYLFILIFIFSLSLYFFSIDFRKVAETEIEELQSFATSFSSPVQLYDQGDSPYLSSFSTQDIFPFSSNLIKSVFEEIRGKDKANIKEIKIFIKFKNLEKILRDREIALAKGINTESTNVPCKISDGAVIYKCKVRLKGDLPDHWTSVKRMSLRIGVKGGYIHGMKEFSIQKPRVRQFPYDFAFHSYNNQLGKLSSNGQEFYRVSLNGENWGVMNAEPIIDSKFLEVNEVKRLGIFRISNQDIWAYERINGRYQNYFISDPTVNLGMRGNDKEILQNPVMNEIFSHIFLSLSNKDGEIFDRKIMISNLVLSMLWGNLHTLYNANTWYTWNPYSNKLEPIMTDQGEWLNYIDLNSGDMTDLPFEYRILFKNKPLQAEEFIQELEYFDDFFNANNPIDRVNSIKEKYFPNDQKFTKTPIFSNIQFLKSNAYEIVKKINLGSNFSQEKVKYSKISSEQLKKIHKVAQIIHFTDGTIRVYNLLGNEIRINSLFADSIKLDFDITVPPSKKESLSFVDLKSDLYGIYNDKISIKLNINGEERLESALFSIKNIDYESEFPKEVTSLCKDVDDGSYCKLNGTLNINNSVIFNSKIIIEPGTNIILNEGGNLIFNSSVSMNGTKEKPINIEGINTGGILIKNKDGESSLIKNTNFYNLATMDTLLKRYTGSVNGYGGTFNIEDTFITSGVAEDQLNIVAAEVDVNGLEITNAISDAFDCDFCTGDITNIILSEVGGDGLDISGSNLNVKDMKAFNIKDKAFSVGEKSIAFIDEALYDKVATGIAVKDSSTVKASNISLQNVEYDLFMTYIKKPFYEGITKLEVNNYYANDNKHKEVCVREINTFLKINNKDCVTSLVNVDELYEGRMKK